jgi:hypothetical protein
MQNLEGKGLESLEISLIAHAKSSTSNYVIHGPALVFMIYYEA